MGNLKYFAVIFILISCKPTDSEMDTNPAENSSPAVQQQNSQNSQPAQEATIIPDDISIHLFDDEERIYIYPAELQKEEDGEELPPMLVSTVSGHTFELLGSSAIASSIEYEEAENQGSNLNLTVALKPRLRDDSVFMPNMTKKNPDLPPYRKLYDDPPNSIREKEPLNQSTRKARRRKWVTRNVVEPAITLINFSKNPKFKLIPWEAWEASKIAYFTKRIQKKYKNLSYNKYSFIDQVGSNVKAFADVEVPPTVGNATLGMLPTTGILKDVRFEMNAHVYARHSKFENYLELDDDVVTKRGALKELEVKRKKDKSNFSPDDQTRMDQLSREIKELDTQRIALRDDISADTIFRDDPDFRPLDIYSMVEDFELAFINQYAGKANRIADVTEINVRPNLTTVKDFGKGRYKVEIETDNSEEALALGIYRWNQYSTPDRTMMTSNVLSSAAYDLADSMMAGQHIYIHCKSGISRSASTLATARAMILIDGVRGKKVRPSPAEIDELIDEQIAMINKDRPEVKIHQPQRDNIKTVLYQYANRDFL